MPDNLISSLKGGGGHFGTYQSAIHGVASERGGNLKKLRAQLFSKPMPKFGPKLPRRLAFLLFPLLVYFNLRFVSILFLLDLLFFSFLLFS